MRRFKLKSLLAGIMTGLLLLPATSFADHDKDKKSKQTSANEASSQLSDQQIEGTVTQVTDKTIVVGGQTIQLDQQSSLKAMKEVPLSKEDIAVGDHVKITTKTEGGQLVAESVIKMPEGMETTESKLARDLAGQQTQDRQMTRDQTGDRQFERDTEFNRREQVQRDRPLQGQRAEEWYYDGGLQRRPLPSQEQPAWAENERQTRQSLRTSADLPPHRDQMAQGESDDSRSYLKEQEVPGERPTAQPPYKEYWNRGEYEFQDRGQPDVAEQFERDRQFRESQQREQFFDEEADRIYTRGRAADEQADRVWTRDQLSDLESRAKIDYQTSADQLKQDTPDLSKPQVVLEWYYKGGLRQRTIVLGR